MRNNVRLGQYIFLGILMLSFLIGGVGRGMHTKTNQLWWEGVVLVAAGTGWLAGAAVLLLQIFTLEKDLFFFNSIKVIFFLALALPILGVALVAMYQGIDLILMCLRA